MSNVPKPQKYLIYVTWFFTGLMWLGGVIGVVNDTLDLINLPISIIGTLIITAAYFGAQQYLKHNPWHTDSGLITRLNFGMVLPLLGMIALLWLPQILQFIPEKRVFPPEQEGETLIVIATFYYTEGVVNVAAHDEIRRAIQEKIDELNLEDVRVHVEPTIIQSASRGQAEALGERYNASLIIWGSDTGIRIEVNFLNLKQPDFIASEVTISETEKTQLANPEGYSQYVVAELPPQLTVLSLFALGQTEINQGNYIQAINLIETGVNSFSELQHRNNDWGFDIVYFDLGWLHQITNQFAKAIVNYSKAITLNSQNFKAFNNRGVAYAQQGDHVQALADLDQAIVLNPKDAGLFSNQGVIYARQGDYAQAIVNYDRAITLNPEYSIAFLNLGGIYGRQGDYEQAIANYDQASVHNPNFAGAYNNRGLIYEKQGDYEQAIANYNQAIILNSDFAEAYNNRGVFYTFQGDYMQAVEDFDRAIFLQPGYTKAFYNRGVAYAEQGAFEQAIANFNQAIALDPDNPEALHRRGLVYAWQGLYTQAIVDFDQAITLKPEYVEALNNRGIIYATKENHEQAIADFDRAIALNPMLAQAFTNRGLAHENLGNYEQANVDYNRAISLDPTFSEAYLNRGIFLLKLDRNTEALSDLRIFLALNTKSARQQEIENIIKQLEIELEN